MKTNTPIKEDAEPKENPEEKLTNNLKANAEEATSKTESQEELVSKIDEQYERTKPLYESRRSTFYDVIFIAFVLGVLAFVWVYIYKKPIPFAIKRFLGMDDTVYPEMYEKMRQNK